MSINRAQTIANSVNAERNQQIDEQKTRDTNDFVNGCEQLRSVSNSVWGNSSLQQQGSVRFEKTDYSTYVVYHNWFHREAVNQQVELFRNNGFTAEIVEDKLLIKNPYLINFYENEHKQLHGWPYSSNHGLPFFTEVMNQCRILGVHKIDINFLDAEANRSQVIRYLQNEGYTVKTPQKRGSNPARITAINPRGENRLTMTVHLE